MAEEGTNRAIAKNTVILYIRSFVMMAIGIFTSRVILQALGVSDFGLYGAIGSMVAMFTIINGVLAAGSSRFLTFELGRKDPIKLQKTFSASFAMHCAMALVLLILFETIGLWLVNAKLNIPEGREFAANVVYQISILTCLMGLTQVPYGAVIIAHERFDIFAYVGIGEALFKLFLPLCLVYGSFGDNLIAFAVICAIWTIGLQIFYRVYCYRLYPETRLSICRDKSIYKSMLSYSIWDLVGQFCATGNGQGLNILINIFFGVNFNASRSVAYTVEDKITQFNGNFMTSVVPQITKSYAKGDLARFFELINEFGKFSFYLLFFLSLPVFIEADYLIGLWLVEVPPQTTLFLRLIMVYMLLRAPSRTIITGVHATGDVKFLNLTSGVYSAGTFLPSIYLLFKCGAPVWSCFLVQIFNANVCTVLETISLRRKVPFSLRKYFTRVYLHSFSVVSLAIIPAFLPSSFMEPSIWRLVLTGLFSAIPSCVAIVYFGIKREYRDKLIAFAYNKVNNFRIK